MAVLNCKVQFAIGILLVSLIFVSHIAQEVNALKRRAKSIPDDLSDVVDDEEDEEWKNWGKKKEPVEDKEDIGFEIGNGPIDVSKLMNKQASGPQLAFARLRPDPKRTKEDVDEIGSIWSALLRTGGMADQIYAIDEGTILISILDGKYMDEIKSFVLSRDEAYEFEWKNNKTRRPGDPPLESLSPKEDPPASKKKLKKKAKKSKKKSETTKEEL